MFAVSVGDDTVTFVQMWSLWGTLRAWLEWLDHQGMWLVTEFAWDDTWSAPPRSEWPRRVKRDALRFMRWDWICRPIDRIGDPPYLLAAVTQQGEPGEMYMPAALAVKAGLVSEADARATLHAFANRPRPCPPTSILVQQDQLQARDNEIAAKSAQKIEDHERSAECTRSLVAGGLPEWLASRWCGASAVSIVLAGVAVVGAIALAPSIIRGIRAARSSPPGAPPVPSRAEGAR